jgi:hypothetical protein
MCKKLLVVALVLGLANLASAELLGQWNFEGTSGVIVPDVAGGAQDGTVNGATVVYTGGPHGKAIYFSGGNEEEYLDLGGGKASDKAPSTWADMANYTIQMDVKADGLKNKANGGYWSLGTKAGPGNTVWSTWYIEGCYTDTTDWVEWKTYGGASMPQGDQGHFDGIGAKLDDGQWHTILFSAGDDLNGSIRTAIYLDGVRLFDRVTLADPMMYGNWDIHIGHVRRWPLEVWKGWIDNVQIYGGYIPEPATLVLLCLGGLALLRKRS